MDKIKRSLHLNFKDGKATVINPVQGQESIEDLPLSRRAELVSLRLQVGSQQFTISRKKNGKTAEGFFYHLQEGYKVLGGEGKDKPFVAERIGFCYNAYGDAVAIHINYMTGNITNYDENVQSMGVNVELFHKVDNPEEYRAEFVEFRKAFLAAEHTKEAPFLVFPQISGLPAEGMIPRVLFNSKDVSSYNIKHT